MENLEIYTQLVARIDDIIQIYLFDDDPVSNDSEELAKELSPYIENNLFEIPNDLSLDIKDRIRIQVSLNILKLAKEYLNAKQSDIENETF